MIQVILPIFGHKRVARENLCFLWKKTEAFLSEPAREYSISFSFP